MTPVKLVMVSRSRLAALVLAVAAWWAVVGYDHGRIVLWSQVEAQLAALSLVVAATATVWGGIEGQMVWGRGEEYVPAVALNGGYLPWLAWVGDAVWMAAGVAAGAAAGVWEISGALAGRPNPVFPFVWLAVVVAFSSVGNLIGRVSSRLVGPVLGGIVVYLGLGLAVYGSTHLRNLMPIADGSPRIGYSYRAEFLLLQIAFLVGIAGLAATAAVAGVRRRVRPWMLAVAAGVVVIGVTLTSIDPVGPEPVGRVCGGSTATICGPAPMEGAIPGIDAVVAVFETATGQEIATVTMTDGPDSIVLEAGEVTLNTGGLRRDPVRSTAAALLRPAHAGCEDASANQTVAEAVAYLADPQDEPVSEIARRVAAQLMGGDWLREHWVDLRNCTVAFEDLPGVP